VIRFAVLAALVGCGGDNKQSPGDAARPLDAPADSARAIDAGVAADASCFTNVDPSSHYQIINACTTALKIYTDHPRPPLLQPNGALPPLPP
jgi:hypothetical protein